MTVYLIVMSINMEEYKMDLSNTNAKTFCTNCGNELRPNAKFCVVCGTSVEAMATSTPA